MEVHHARASLEAKEVFDCTLRLEGDLDATQRARLQEIAEKCSVHRTLARGSDVCTILVPIPPPAATRVGGAAEHAWDAEAAGRD